MLGKYRVASQLVASRVVLNSMKLLSYDRLKKSRDSSVGTATGWTSEVIFVEKDSNFSFLRRAQTGSGAHPVSYPMGTGGSSLWG
jgi:hypothetical protein